MRKDAARALQDWIRARAAPAAGCRRPAGPSECRETALCLGRVVWVCVRVWPFIQSFGAMRVRSVWRPESLVLKLCCGVSGDVNFCPGTVLGFVGELCQ